MPGPSFDPIVRGMSQSPRAKGLDVPEVTAGSGRQQHISLVFEIADALVMERAISAFIADAQQWSLPPHEDIGRAFVLLRRLEEARA